MKHFAAQVDNSFEAAMEKLTRHYGEFEPEEQVARKIQEVASLDSGNTKEIRELEDYLRSAIGIFGRKLVRSYVINIIVKFSEPLRRE